MSKIRRIFETTQELNFNSPQKEFNLYRNRFLGSELGKFYKAIPWQDLCKCLQIKDKAKGRDAIFSPQGKLALMFLKSYSGLSDKKLIEQLNGNIEFQMFCDIHLGLERLKDFKIVSRIRTTLGKQLDIKSAQAVLSQAWKPYLESTNILLEDATCYESSIRHPTNVKLLWESVNWLYGQIKLTCKYLRIRTPRTKYLKQQDRYFQYSRKRRKDKKERKVLTRSLLHLLNKLIEEMNSIEETYADYINFHEKYYQRKETILKVLEQQQKMFITEESLPGRIVSLSKSYIRPIVRGKETKKVEFGAKVNMIQIDGINFIEHLSFDPFNESTHFINSIRYGRELFGRISHASADAIYATNKNRKWATAQKIVTGFTRKGKAGKYEGQRKIMCSELNRERATRMEGSFGTEKEYYGLQKIKARTKQNEILCIFFGVHTANAVRMIGKMKIKKTYLLVA